MRVRVYRVRACTTGHSTGILLEIIRTPWVELLIVLDAERLECWFPEDVAEARGHCSRELTAVCIGIWALSQDNCSIETGIQVGCEENACNPINVDNFFMFFFMFVFPYG